MLIIDCRTSKRIEMHSAITLAIYSNISTYIGRWPFHKQKEEKPTQLRMAFHRRICFAHSNYWTKNFARSFSRFFDSSRRYDIMHCIFSTLSSSPRSELFINFQSQRVWKTVDSFTGTRIFDGTANGLREGDSLLALCALCVVQPKNKSIVCIPSYDPIDGVPWLGGLLLQTTIGSGMDWGMVYWWRDDVHCRWIVNFVWRKLLYSMC